MIFTDRYIIVTKTNNRTHIKVCPLKLPFIWRRKLFFDTTNDHNVCIALKDIVAIKNFRPHTTKDLGATLKHYM